MEGDFRSLLIRSLSAIFLSTPSGWRATRLFVMRFAPKLFLSTPSGWRATYQRERRGWMRVISIHALRVEGDTATLTDGGINVTFLSTPSGWRATFLRCRFLSGFGDFYPRPPGGGRPDKRRPRCLSATFLSTPSGWRATLSDTAKVKNDKFLSTPSGWRATTFRAAQGPRTPISIHALRVEGDGMTDSFALSAWISIHALRVEGDRRFCLSTRHPHHFYPRPPGGGRQVHRFRILPRIRFLSTPSGWRATTKPTAWKSSVSHFYPRPPGGGRRKKVQQMSKFTTISIHALRVEGDRCPDVPKGLCLLFLSTPSGWRATIQAATAGTRISPFLSTPSGWRATFRCKAIRSKLQNFYPRPPGGGRPFRPSPTGHSL